MDINRETWEEAWAEAEQFGMEEAQAAPQQAVEDAPEPTPEVHDEPGIPQQEQQQANVEDAPLQAASHEQQQGIADDFSGIEWDEPPELAFNGGDAGWQPGSSTQAEELTSDGSIWDSLSPDFPEVEWGEPDYTSNGGDAGWDSQLGEEWSEDFWGPGADISGGAIDYGYAEFGDGSDKVSADLISEQEEAASEAQSETQSNFTDAAEYQEVLDDLDNGNIEDVREFLEDLAHRGEDDVAEEAPQHAAPGDPEEGKLVEEGISIDDIVGGEENNVQEGIEDANNNSTEEYTYNEEAYEDAQDALKDLKHALKHGDEEERAEALEKLQGYLGGFDKGDAEDQEATETQDEQIPSVSEVDSIIDLPDSDGLYHWENSDSWDDITPW